MKNTIMKAAALAAMFAAATGGAFAADAATADKSPEKKQAAAPAQNDKAKAKAKAKNKISVPARPSKRTLISHRGESIDAPENTLPAFKTAVERGFGFECDVYLSKDGRVFTFHDGDLKRTTDGKSEKKCAEANWEGELENIDVGGWGKWKGSKFVGTRPALLEEVLALAKNGRYIYVEVKTGPEIVPFIKKVFEAQKNATHRNTLFIAFNAETCRVLKEQMPRYKTYWLTSSRHGVKGADGKTVTKPVTAQYIIDTLKRIKADGVDCHFAKKIVTKELVKAVKDAGFEFHVWTVDRLDLALEAFKCGAQTVTTNCAKALLDEYKAKRTAERKAKGEAAAEAKPAGKEKPGKKPVAAKEKAADA